MKIDLNAEIDRLTEQKTRIDEQLQALVELRDRFYSHEKPEEKPKSVPVAKEVPITHHPEATKKKLTAAHQRQLERTNEAITKLYELAARTEGKFTLKDCAALLFSNTTQPSTNACSFLGRHFSHFEKVEPGLYRVKVAA
jgi:hypothetical protein